MGYIYFCSTAHIYFVFHTMVRLSFVTVVLGDVSILFFNGSSLQGVMGVPSTTIFVFVYKKIALNTPQDQ